MGEPGFLSSYLRALSETLNVAGCTIGVCGSKYSKYAFRQGRILDRLGTSRSSRGWNTSTSKTRSLSVCTSSSLMNPARNVLSLFDIFRGALTSIVTPLPADV